MSIGRFIWKLYKGHILISMMLDTFMLALILIFPNQTWYQVLISWGILGVYWYFIYCTFDKEALADAKNGQFSYKKPIIAALVFNIPNYILFAGAILEPMIFTDSNMFRPIFSYWNSGYLNFMIMLEEPIWLMAVIILISFPVICFLYSRGMAVKRKTDALVEETEQNRGNLHYAKDFAPEEVQKIQEKNKREMFKKKSQESEKED